MEEITQFELSKEFLDRFRQAVADKDQAFIASSLESVNTVDISALLEEFNADESKFVLSLLGNEITADVVSNLDEDTRTRFLKLFEPSEVAEVVKDLDSDDAADILGELSIQKREEVINLIDDQETESNILELLHYEEDVAGGLMAKELIKANFNWTIIQTIDEIRRQAEKVEKIYSVYVVDDNGKLLGRVSLKKILLTNDKTKIGDIYDADIVSVDTFTEEEEVASIMRKYDLDAVPVVNTQGKLVGRITVDDILDVITEMAEEERQLMSGIAEDVEEDDSIWILTRARLPWLIIGVAGGLLSAEFMGLFEEDIMNGAWIALFLPLIQATGGNVGIQSSSIVVQSLANPSAFEEGLWKRLLKVFLVALLNALVLSILVFGASNLMGFSLEQCFVISLALFSVVVLASFVGTITPLILNKVGFNPALASGPFITTLNDILGLAIYFYIIHLLINNF
ncbi:MAG: magnesium transporter [Cyclobacteriaceae bacterium]|nr:magnesium transporter [Cyclobacteriaceae bacterium]